MPLRDKYSESVGVDRNPVLIHTIHDSCNFVWYIKGLTFTDSICGSHRLFKLQINEFIDSFTGLIENVRLDFLEGYPSGQRGQTVNLLAMPS